MELDVDIVEELICKDKEEDSIVYKVKEREELEKEERRKYNLIRYMCIVVDLSCSSKLTDLKPTRLQAVIRELSHLVHDFLKQNPLSQMSLLVLQEGICQVRVGFTIDANKIIQALRQLQSVVDSEISLQNCLVQLQQLYKSVPLYAFKEVLLIHSSNSSKDHSDILSDLDLVRQMNIVINIISLSGEMYLCQTLSGQTQGCLDVALDNPHLRQLINKHIELSSDVASELLVCLLVPVAFPCLFKQHPPVLCSCCNKLQTDYYQCPQCSSYQCNVPTKCSICQLGLITHHHIKRKALHYNPAALFSSNLQLLDNLDENLNQCFGCQTTIKQQINQKIINIKCKNCQNNFCMQLIIYIFYRDCDLYIRKTLLNCPGCI